MRNVKNEYLFTNRNTKKNKQSIDIEKKICQGLLKFNDGHDNKSVEKIAYRIFTLNFHLLV